jgi:predicted dehydrogenase
MLFNRRDFIRKAGGAAAGFALPAIVPAAALGRTGSVPPSDRILLGCIGVGSMGSGHVRSFLGYDDVRITAVCDVRSTHRDRAKETVDRFYGEPACAAIHDYRELLALPGIDAVLIAVPDHWHALIGIEAARRGKSMYYEKPMGVSVAEAKAVREAVRAHGVVFQFGTQQRSDARFRFAVELARNGRLGVPVTVLIGSADFQPIPDQPSQPVPPDLDYEFWLGPAPWAPYTFERCTRSWTLIRDYSLGCVSGAWGIHHVDIAQWAVGADDGGPVSVEGWGRFSKSGLYDTAIAWEIEHAYANGARVKHMDMRTALTKADPFKLAWLGILFQGPEGWVYVNRDLIDAHPKSLLKVRFGPDDVLLPASRDHRRNFLDAVRARRDPVCPVETAVRSDTVCQLDDIAMRLGRRLEWDPVSETFINDSRADALLLRPMRSPWRL